MTLRFCVVALVLLAACGADDPPFRPAASAGVNVGPGGVSTTGGVVSTNGTITIGVGF